MQSRRHQELENKAAALKRELDIQRFSVQQYKDKLQQMHELLVSREEEHRYTPLSVYLSVYQNKLALKAELHGIIRILTFSLCAKMQFQACIKLVNGIILSMTSPCVPSLPLQRQC